VGPQAVGSAAVQVTLPNAETASSIFSFFLTTPTITGFTPSTADGFETTTILVEGTNFQPTMGVAFGTQNPPPQNVTPASFEVEVGGGQAEGSALVEVTLLNSETASSSFPFFLISPVISGLSPDFVNANSPTPVTVTGSGFHSGVSVQIGSQSPTPTNVADTSFDVVVGPQTPGIVSVVVTNPNGKFDSTTYPIIDAGRAFLTQATSVGNAGGIAAVDAICASEASAAGLPGVVYLAWLGDGSTSPSVRFVQTQGYVLVDGTTVATSYADLTDGSIAATITMFADGTTTGSNPNVWTGVTPSGTAESDHCAGWTISTGFGNRGMASDPNAWTGPALQGCGNVFHFYCFEQ
jgi:hypothetical protein